MKTSQSKDTLYITMETLARVLYAYDNDPLLIFKGTKYLFDTDEITGKYWQVFGQNGKEVETLGKDDLYKVAGLFFLWTQLNEKIKDVAKKLKAEEKETSFDYQALLS